MKTLVLSLIGASMACLPACGSPSSSGSPGIGGGAGGSSASGAAGTGGTTGTGGTAGTGGTTGTGGTSQAGGASGTGGTTTDPCSFVACGGNVIGTWQYASACPNMTPSSDGATCPTTSAIVDQSISGSLIFNADGTWTSSFSEVVDYTLDQPANCQTAAGCATNQRLLTYPGTTTNCTWSAIDGCHCTQNYVDGADQMGPYTVSGAQVTRQAVYFNATTMVTNEFCVSGNTLKMHDSYYNSILTLTKSP